MDDKRSEERGYVWMEQTVGNVLQPLLQRGEAGPFTSYLFSLSIFESRGGINYVVSGIRGLHLR